MASENRAQTNFTWLHSFNKNNAVKNTNKWQIYIYLFIYKSVHNILQLNGTDQSCISQNLALFEVMFGEPQIVAWYSLGLHFIDNDGCSFILWWGEEMRFLHAVDKVLQHYMIWVNFHWLCSHLSWITFYKYFIEDFRSKEVNQIKCF